MKEFFKQNGIFVGLSLILVIVLGLALLYISKGELHLLLCDRHTPARDIFYRYYTHVAEWFPYVVCIAVLLFGRIGDGVFASSAMLLSALSTQVIKHIVNAPRPVIWFGNNMPEINLPLVEGVKMNLWFSFPSGHTTSFFALAFVVGILMSQKWPKYGGLIQVVLFVLATLGGYSRIYLSQHFSADVFAGVIVGVCITILCYVVFNQYKDQKWFNFRLIAKK